MAIRWSITLAIGDHAAQAQVHAVAAQGAQARSEPVHLQVPVHRRLSGAAGCCALGVEAGG